MFYYDVFGGRDNSGCFTVICVEVEYIVGVVL